MTESFILDYIPKRMKQLDYQKWHIQYRDIAIPPESEEQIRAYNELWFIVGNPKDIYIDSDYGAYDGSQIASHEYAHEHRGLITIRNTSKEKLRITFIQAIIVN